MESAGPDAKYRLQFAVIDCERANPSPLLELREVVECRRDDEILGVTQLS
jgi:hypothetical protein